MYKTIVVHVDGAPQARERIALAGLVAQGQQAHLVGAATAPPGQPEARRPAQEALKRFETQARGFDVSYETRLGEQEAAANLALQARYADLVVLSQSRPDSGMAQQPAPLPEQVALQAGRPVLILPHIGTFAHLDRHALVAWDGSRAATRAIGDALPLLRASKLVTVAVFNPEREHGVHGAQPGADIALYLARHGIQVAVQRQTTSPEQPVGEALLSLAANLQADLFVMGAYGHARWNEILLGGVTRTLLGSMTLPVLMSH
ncbi:universal stress protein [Janthinobacterium sp. GB1R12]|uniref:universal stress protein n=1 Tax=Janthinobacterium sp. GB1R12 TaxID=3424190 RepID=UPI003F1EA299